MWMRAQVVLAKVEVMKFLVHDICIVTPLRIKYFMTWQQLD